MKRLTWVYLALTVVVAPAFALLGAHPAALAVVNVTALAVIGFGISRNRLPVWPCWGPIAGALATWTVAVVWVSVLPPSSNGAEVPTALVILFLAPFLALGLGLVALLHCQRETIAAPLVDVGMIAVAASLLLIEFGLGLQLIPDLIVLALGFRLLIGSSQPPAGWLLLGGISAGVISDFVFTAGSFGSTELSRGIAQGGWILARSAIAAAALHPSAVELMRRRRQRSWPPLVAMAATIGPAVGVPLAIAFHAEGDPRATWTVLAGSSVLVMLALLRVGLMVNRHRDLKTARSEEQAKFRALVEQLPVATYISDVEHPARALYVSDQVADLTGFLPQEIIADLGLWDEQIPEPHRAKVFQALHDHKRSGEPLSLEYPFETRDRRTIWLGHRACLVRDRDGKPLFSEGVVYDITDAKEREKPVLQRMRVLHAVFESAPIGVATMGPRGELLSVNPALERMLGYSLDELRAKTLEEVMGESSADELRDWLRVSLKTGDANPLQTEAELSARDGHAVCADVTLLSLATDDDGERPPLCVIVEDVTERRQSRLAYKEAAEQLETVISNLPVIVFRYDAQRRMDMISGRATTSLGPDLRDLVGRSASEILADVPDALRAVESAFAGHHEHVIADFRDFGGWWEVWYSPLRNDEDEVVGVLGVGAHVAERVAQEKATQESLSLLHTTFDSIADAVVATDLEGRPVTYNRQFPSMWGVDPEQWARWDSVRRREYIFSQIKQPTDARFRAIERAIEMDADRQHAGWYEIELNNGRVFESRVAPQMVNDEVIGRVVTFHDVTEQRRSSQLMQDQARILKNIARAAPLDAVLAELCDTVAKYNDDVHCSISVVDEEAESLLAKAPPELQGFYEEVAPVTIGPCNGSCGTAAFRNERVVVEDVHSDPLWVEYRAAASHNDVGSCWSEPIRSSEGSVLGTFAIFASSRRVPDQYEIRLVELLSGLAAIAIERDLASRRRQELEEQVRQAEKMQAVGSLARGFAHDLGNVLAAVGLNADLLRHEVRSEQGRDALNDLEKATLMAGRQVNDLLNLMRPPYTELVDLSVMVHEMASLLRSVVRAGVTLDIEVETSAAYVEVDVSQFHQVLLNLVLNASQAVSDDGTIVVRVTTDPNSDSVLLSVEDDGAGMDVETMEQAFEPYFTTKRDGGAKGVGLGLTSASSAVAAVGGLITIDSEPGHGTKVRVHLPIASDELPSDPGLVIAGGSE